MKRVCIAAGEEGMLELGALLASALEAGTLVFLVGELGMGKTTLARGILRALGHRGAVKSPTYTLVEPYELGAVTVYHFDLYRLGDPGELEYMGIRDYFDGTSLVLVEWPERGEGALPPADLLVTIEPAAEGRRLEFSALTLRGERCLGVLPESAAIRRDMGVQ